ncbi:hypothetical protein [Haloarchaeobius sp. HRN-SO-5]|uniref:hypothetical protein n=1 Tax=Haloarchaeobius sp. HRN-SO-5 TaxID=3446118 RepID=UPI003EB9554D
MDFVFGALDIDNISMKKQEPITWDGSFVSHNLIETTPSSGPGILIDTRDDNGWLNVKDASTDELIFRVHVASAGGYSKGDVQTFVDGAGTVVTTPDGAAEYRIGVDNSGNVTTTQI